MNGANGSTLWHLVSRSNSLGIRCLLPWQTALVSSLAKRVSRPALCLSVRRNAPNPRTPATGGTLVKTAFLIAMHAGDHFPPASGGRSAAMRLARHDLSSPVLLAPVGSSRITHADGEVAAAHAAGDAGTALILCSISGRATEDVRNASVGPVRYQLYLIGRALRRRLRLLGRHKPDSPHSS